MSQPKGGSKEDMVRAGLAGEEWRVSLLGLP